MTRSELLHAAEVCVCGQREEDYGTPEDSFHVDWKNVERSLSINAAKEPCIGSTAFDDSCEASTIKPSLAV